MTVKYGYISSIPGYRFGTDGSVWTCKIGKTKSLGLAWRLLRPYTVRGGYKRVWVSASGLESKHRPVHQLILEAFVGPKPTPLHVVRHINRQRCDNRLSNLKWGTYKDNADDRNRHGTTAIGEKNGRSVLTSGQVADLKADRVAGLSYRKLGKKYNVSNTTARRICVGMVRKDG